MVEKKSINHANVLCFLVISIRLPPPTGIGKCNPSCIGSEVANESWSDPHWPSGKQQERQHLHGPENWSFRKSFHFYNFVKWLFRNSTVPTSFTQPTLFIFLERFWSPWEWLLLHRIKSFPQTIQADELPNPAEPHPARLIFGNTFGWIFMGFVLPLHFCIYWLFLFIYTLFSSYSFLLIWKPALVGDQEESLTSVIFMSFLGIQVCPQSLRITYLKSVYIRDCQSIKMFIRITKVGWLIKCIVLDPKTYWIWYLQGETKKCILTSYHRWFLIDGGLTWEPLFGGP